MKFFALLSLSFAILASAQGVAEEKELKVEIYSEPDFKGKVTIGSEECVELKDAVHSIKFPNTKEDIRCFFYDLPGCHGPLEHVFKNTQSGIEKITVIGAKSVECLVFEKPEPKPKPEAN